MQAPAQEGQAGLVSGLRFPFGHEDFERLREGESVEALGGWSVECAGGPGALEAWATSAPAGRRLRVDDAGVGTSAVRTPLLTAPEPRGYRWELRIALASLPAAGTSGGRALVLEHLRTDGPGSEALFGLELGASSVQLFARTAQGATASAPLFSFANGVPLGAWFRLRLELDLARRVVRAAVGPGAAVELPCELAGLDTRRHRLAYRGDTAGNALSFRLDDLAVQFLAPLGPEPFELDLDALVDGQDLAPDALGPLVRLTSSGPNAGAALFDSTPGGPNDPSQDLDLLVDRGNLLILQTDASTTQSVPGIFDRPNDDADGGTFHLEFPRAAQPLALDLVDLEPSLRQSARVTLSDAGGRRRVYEVPPGFTNDLVLQGAPAVGTLALDTLAPQPGVNASATATEDAGFDEADVLRLDIQLGGSGAVDEILLAAPRFDFPGRGYGPINSGDLARADFDGDGELDFAAIDFSEDALVVFRNRGDGIYLEPVSYPTTHFPLGMAAGELDGQAGIDVVVVGSRKVSVHPSLGDGTFGPPREFGLGFQPGSVVAADLDGDGRTDLAVGPDRAAPPLRLGVLWNEGAGAFSAPTELALPSDPNVGPIESADLDGNGFPDLFLAQHDAGVSVMRSLGGRSFLPRESYAVLGAHNVTGADLDGDGDLDLATSNEGNGTVMFPNRGDGTFGPRVRLDVGARTRGVAAGDVDGDGDNDLVLGSGRSLVVFANHGDGSFAAAAFFKVGINLEEVQLGDIDGNGSLDVLACDSRLVLALPNEGDGTFRQRADEVGGVPATTQLTAADLDADGDMDLAVLYRTGQKLFVLENRGDATFEPGVAYPCLGGASGIAAGDLDQDGDVDLAVTCQVSGLVRIYTNQGGGTFGPSVAFGPFPEPRQIVAADMDGDGVLDLVVTTEDLDLLVLRNAGDGTFSQRDRQFVLGPGIPAVGDLDGDGDLDVVVTLGFDDAMRPFLNAGDGTLVPGVTQPAVDGAFCTAIADLDGDGLLEALVGGFEQLSVHPGLGGGSFGPPVDHAVFHGASTLAAVDFDGDGDPDVAVSNSVDSVLSIFVNERGALGPRRDHASGNSVAMTAVDLNGDGAPDLAAVGLQSVSVLLNRRD